MNFSKDVFISYRRDGGSTVARMLYELLKARNVSAFFDAETLINGDFGEQIAVHLEQAENVVLVVTPTLFERCQNQDDWVRKEIETALKHKKGKIIPVFVNGVTAFPANLPPSIAAIATYNGIYFGHDNFDKAMETLLKEIKSPFDNMIDTWLSFDEKQKTNYDEVQMHLEHFHGLENLVGKSEWNGMVKVIYDYYRTTVKKRGISDETELANLFKGYRLTDLKNLCEDLKIDRRGGHAAVNESLHCFTKGQQLQGRPNNRDVGDPLEVLIGFLVKSKKDKMGLRTKLKEDFDITEGKNTEDVLRQVLDIKDMQDVISKYFDEAEIKNVCLNIFENDSGRKKLLIDQLIEFVNFQIDYAPNEELADDWS